MPPFVIELPSGNIRPARKAKMPKSKHIPQTHDELCDEIARLFKQWIVKRPDHECQVLFPLSELDGVIKKMIETMGESIAKIIRES